MNKVMKKRRTPKPSSLAAKHRMEAGKPRNTMQEIELRNALRALGIEHFQANQKQIPGLHRDADILFPAEKIAVFVDGWLPLPTEGRSAGRAPTRA
jgi:DNA mismatch endonuclease (patch repair protein)